MRIVYVVTRADDIGGAQVHVRDLSQALIARGHEVTVLAGGAGKFTAELDAARIPFRNIPHLSTAISPARDVPAVLEIVRALREIEPDLVCAHTAKAGFLGRIAAAVLGIPSVFTPHGWAITERISPLQGRIFRCAEMMAALVSSHIINVCEFERRLALECRIAPYRKLAVIHNGIPDVKTSLLAKPEHQPPVLIMLARFAEPKQHSVLLKALDPLKHLAWTLEFVGDGPLENEVRTHAAQLGLLDRLRFHGFCSDPASKLARAQLLVLASRFEAFPYSIIEGMRAGLPIVASDVGGIKEAVVHGVTGLLSPSGDVAVMRNHLETCIRDGALRKRFGENGRNRFLQLFTIDRMVRDTLSAYNEVLAARDLKRAGHRRRVAELNMREIESAGPQIVAPTPNEIAPAKARAASAGAGITSGLSVRSDSL